MSFTVNQTYLHPGSEKWVTWNRFGLVEPKLTLCLYFGLLGVDSCHGFYPNFGSSGGNLDNIGSEKTPSI